MGSTDLGFVERKSKTNSHETRETSANTAQVVPLRRNQPVILISLTSGSEPKVGGSPTTDILVSLQRDFEVVRCTGSDDLSRLVKVHDPFALIILAEVGSEEAVDVLDLMGQSASDLRSVLLLSDSTERCSQIPHLALRHSVYDVLCVDQIVYDDLSSVLQRLKNLVDLTRKPGAAKSSKRSRKPVGRLIGASPAMMDIHASVRRLAKTDLPVLITGESGTGKEETARAIHQTSDRRKGPFVPINCAALPPSLIDSELFGYEKGAFTGATGKKIGQLELADGGTLFLDEIGDMPLETQAHLLRFLQEGTFSRLGGTEVRSVNARIISATHVNLELGISESSFREDLYYRLRVLPLHVPPLRERGEDIQLLADHFLEKFGKAHGRRSLHLSREARAAIQVFQWPGNVRELMSAIAHAVVMCRGQVIHSEDLGLPSHGIEQSLLPTLAQARARTDKKMLKDAFMLSGQNIKKAAEHLGISRVAFYRLLKKYNMTLTQGELE